MKILFVRPPRYRWPFHSEKSSFWQPLGFASMAAVLRANIDGLDIKIMDCPVLKYGWETTRAVIAREKPDVLCVGEETVSAHEAIKLVKFTKETFPDCVVIAGGSHFPYMIEHTLKNFPFDYIVRFEGELTLLELIKSLKQNPKPDVKTLKKIKGISFMHNNKIIDTELRPLLDMEKLPMPAYDLLPMELYGKGAQSHPDMVAIEHSRGCNCSCNFCILWKQFGKIDMKTGKINPCYRTKSPKKTVEEVLYLDDKYKRKTFCWVDPTWNVDAKWNKEFSELMIKEKLDINHSVWMRADYLVRDEQKGIFARQVNAGIKQVMIGVERTDNDDLAYLEKKGYSFETTKKAFEIVRRYPHVLSVASYIYGIPNETKESMKRFYDLLKEIPFDIGLSIPLTPNPGTKFFDELENRDLIEIKEFKYYNLVNPIARSKYLSRNRLMLNMIWNEIRIRARKEQIVKFQSKAERRKTATSNLAKGKARITFRYLKGILQETLIGKYYNYNIKPEWYEK